MAHGSSRFSIDAIKTAGFKKSAAQAQKTDDGYYGAGFYFSSKIEYSLGYCKPAGNSRGECPVLICWTLPGKVYPVTEPPHMQGTVAQKDFKTLFGKPCVEGFHAHYVCHDNNSYDELVLFRSEQVLPLYELIFDSTAQGIPPGWWDDPPSKKSHKKDSKKKGAH